MIYLDYSATTKTDKDVLDSFNKASEMFFANPNSLHKLGVEAKKIIDESSVQILELLSLKDKEVIYTSGATEANNLAIKGIVKQYTNRGKTIITTRLEHSSIIEPLKKLIDKGFNIKYVDLDNGLVNLNCLEDMLDEETVLVTICAVDSELGFRQPIEAIAKIVKKYPKCFFHVDATQSIGKVNVDYQDVDLISFSAHKFYGIKGIGCLIKNKNIILQPEVEGGFSTTRYRSGTPATSLIISLSKALRLSLISLEEKINNIKNNSQLIIKYINSNSNFILNSNKNSIPHIINFSSLKTKAETFMRILEANDIYISTKTACSNNKDVSESVLAITKNEQLAKSSLRISVSHLTTKKEIEKLIDVIEKNS